MAAKEPKEKNLYIVNYGLQNKMDMHAIKSPFTRLNSFIFVTGFHWFGIIY